MISERRYGAVSDEMRERAVGHVRKLRTDSPAMSRTEACRIAAQEVGVHFNSVRNWLAEADSKLPAANVSDLQAQLQRTVEALELSRELNRELAARLDELSTRPEHR
ncbi:hypothetical protein ACFVVM_32860 [Nocardia sp. NPDC058176]|uniref:hypothetical protein n=1 Tax=Nocardia sp. NPDC058176 TaxID=3346368 RepID=UPI0036D81055